ncbi:MAG TPA: TOBE domain-containing protein [Gemmatimonadaceae bacterium]|jgi:molybdopterin-binding protein|nr:TOBE domain-containing protein [Gemmatimonadaceae bacterium]
MQLSARNQLKGKVSAINTDGLMAEVTIDVAGGNHLISVITRASATGLSLKVGDSVTAVIKSTEVMVAK